jgi:predicted ATPase/DNA-binding SARP family transcriptional activator
VHISVLGPLDVRDDDGGSVTIGGARLRALLIRLALDPGRPVATERLIEAVWGAEPPSGAANALQSLISRLRRQLPAELESGPAGYVLAIRRSDVDAHVFADLAIRGRRLLDERDLAGAAELLGRALALWRGPALSDAADAPFAIGPAARLAEQRLGAIEDRVQAELTLGRTGGLAAELEQLTREHPLRERLYGLLIRTLHEEGRRADALTLYQGLRERLADELGIDPSPDLEAAYLAVLRGGDGAGKPAARPPVAPAAAQPPMPVLPSRAAPGNLPARLTTFVGRDDEVLRVGRLLDQSRLVTVVGPGGAGKTRLSTEAGARLVARGDEFSGGVWFVELAPVLDPLDVPQAVLGALGGREVGLLETHPPVGRDVVDRIAELLASRPSVLILDNCEHLVASAAAFAGRLLAQAPSVRILTTSREPLGIDGEMLYPLGPLALPPAGVRADDGMTYASVRLFADRAHAVRPSLAIDTDTIGAVAEICRRLDGQPLAIELAAARTRSLTPDQIAHRLDDRFRLLTGGSRTALPRHQTLRAVVEWSWDLLEERERGALRRLSVFAGGTTLEAAEAILPHGDFAAEDVLDLLAGLVDKSLVDVVGTTETRYRLLETIQAYAAEKSSAAGETEATAARHAVWYVDLAVDQDSRLRGSDQLAAMDRLGAEHDNLAVALRHVVDHGQADHAVRLVLALSWFWAMRGNHGEAHAWGRDALALPGATRDEGLAEALAFHALHSFASAEPGEGLRAFAHARLISRRLGLERTSPLTVFLAMLAAVTRRDYAALGRSLTSADALKDPWTQAMVRLMRGHFSVNLGHPDEAVRYLSDARDRFVAMGDRWGRASSISGLAELYTYQREFDSALAAVDEALELLRDLRATDEIPQLLVRRGTIFARAGQPDRARRVMESIAERVDGGGATMNNLFAEIGLGEIARYIGDFDEAERRYAHADRESANVKLMHPQMVASLYVGKTHVACGRGNVVAARAALAVAVANALGSQDMPILATCAEAKAAVTAVAGDLEEAALLLGAAQIVRGHPDLSDVDSDRIGREVEQALGAELFARHKALGQALTPEQAMDLIASEQRH